MGMTQWIPSDWLTPLPHHSTDSSPFYPWPEDWLRRNGASESELRGSISWSHLRAPVTLPDALTILGVSKITDSTVN